MPPAAIDLREALLRHLGSTYTLDRELQGGGSARVFLATEVALERRVVLKVLPPDVSRSVDGERFRREILIAAKLQHPHLVPLLNAGTIPLERGGELRWFSMPYVEGPSLRDRLQLGELPMRDVLRLLRELASALAYAHGRGIVHRDIKPENVLLSGGASMVADFGVAKALDNAATLGPDGQRVTTTGTMLGTPAYMAPEQILSALVVDHKADLYAFGCVTYELLTGAPPLVRDSLRATLEAQVTDQPKPLADARADVPAPLADIVMQCLAKEPADRPDTAEAIVAVLDNLASSVHTSGTHPAARPLFSAPVPSLPSAASDRPSTSAAPTGRAPADTPVHSTARSGLTLLGLSVAAVAVLAAVAWFARG